MTVSIKNETSSGFAFVEVILIGVVVIIVGAVGYLFYQNGIAKHSTNNTSSSVANTSSASSSTPAPAGTAASIDQLTQQDATAETSVDNGADTQAEQNATSADSAISNVGGAYDENNL